MIRKNLHQDWKFRQLGTDGWLDATVPGGVHTDLMASGLIEDPFIGDNELKAMWVAEKDWEYELIFQPDAEILAQEKIFLVADGLDTVAEVYLNEKFLGRAANQFRQWIWDITEILLSGDNSLRIIFSGPTAFAAKEQKKRRLIGVSQAIDGAPHLRKAPCQFGWDWGPMLPSIGIWKDIRLEGHAIGKLKDIHLRQLHKNGAVTIQVYIEVDKWGENDLSATISIVNPDGEKIELTKHIYDDKETFEIKIDDPQLWWPNGYGEQNLHKISILLYQGSHLIDQNSFDYGIRTINLIQENDQYGKSFQFVVNGVPIFIKGSNWVPADSFITRFSDKRLEKLIADAADSHQNMLRVWGGGLYEEERFYDLCDKYGILVWQDFIFSCSIYPLDEKDFLDNLSIEVEENVKRIRHRASLALWCGNNEMEWGWTSWGWQKFPLEEQLPTLIEQFPQLGFYLDMFGKRELLPDWQILKNAYDHFFHSLLPNWITEFDPDTPYWPSSPSSNIPFHDPNGEEMGDAHFWDVWHGRKPFTAYRDSFPRFMSEFGFQAFPTNETIEFYTKPEDRNLTSYIMEHHQRGNHGNGLIIAQMTDLYQMPKDFYSWIYLSNILQAEGIRYGVEHWRRNMHRVGGTLYWQLNDCWPVASWASIDYFGRWKALHFAAKKFYAPLLLSIEDNPPKMDIHISNDLVETVHVTIKWSLEEINGDVIESGEIETSVEALSNTCIHHFDFSRIASKQKQRNLIFVCDLWQDSKPVSTSIATFVPSKHLLLKAPELLVANEIDGKDFVINIKSKQFARFVEIKLKGYDRVFSDNYFDIPPGRTKTIRCKAPKGLELDALNELLQIFTLFDSYSG